MLEKREAAIKELLEIPHAVILFILEGLVRCVVRPRVIRR